MTEESNVEVAPDIVADAKAAARARQAEKRQLAAVRKVQILELRRAGLTYVEIAQRLGISDNGVKKAYKMALKDHYRAAAQDERETALLRCDGIIRRWWPKLVQTDDDHVADLASKNLFRALDFQADLWGMKRTQVDVSVEQTMRLPTGPEVWRRVQELRELAAKGTAIDVTPLTLPLPPTAPEAPLVSNGRQPSTNGNGVEPA